MTWAAADIGPLYDVGIAVRPNPDGSTTPLTVKNGKGQNVTLSSVAFMNDPSFEQEEATDLQRKQDLTQYSTSNLIDRDFTNYPKSTQGDWSGGEGQRVFVNPSKYWQGRGIVFPPLPATQPNIQEPFLEAPAQAPAGTAIGSYSGVKEGAVVGLGAGFAFGNNGIIFISNGGLTVTKQNTNNVQELEVWANRIFYDNLSGNIRVTDMAAGDAVFAAFPAGFNNPRLQGGTEGNINYLAAIYHSTSGTFMSDMVRLYTIASVAGVYSVASSVDITVPVSTRILSADFSNGSLYLATVNGEASPPYVDDSINIIAYNIGASSYTTVATLVGYGNAEIATVNGQLVIVAQSVKYGFADTFILQGGTLTFVASCPYIVTGIGNVAPLPIGPLSVTPVMSRIVSMGPFALFTLDYFNDGAADIGPSPRVARVILCVDTLNGTLEVVSKDVGAATLAIPSFGACIAAQAGSGFGTMGTSKWDIVVWTNDPGKYTLAHMGLIGPTNEGGLIFGPGRVVSSITDFTSSAVKLFRGLTVEHDPIKPSGQVTISAFIDISVDRLVVAPIATVTNTTIDSTQTYLPINKMGLKIAYILDWYSTWPNAAPRPLSVSILAATGWVWKMKLALSNETKCNNQAPNAFCFENQQDANTKGIDAVAAYNFLKAIWRQRGSECVVTYPNGDSYNAVFESESFKSAKPFGVSFTSDRPSGLSSFVEVMIREDV